MSLYYQGRLSMSRLLVPNTLDGYGRRGGLMTERSEGICLVKPHTCDLGSVVWGDPGK